MEFTFTVDPMAGNGVGVATGAVGLTDEDVPLLFVVVQPDIATAAKKIQTNIMLDDLHFMRNAPLERIPALKPVTLRLL